MTTKLVPDLGKLWLPEPSVSRPGGVTLPKYHATVIATVRRPKWSIEEALRGLLPDILHPKPGDAVRQLLPFRPHIDPKLFATQLIFASITHNERVDRGASIQHNRCFGGVGTTANGVFTAVAAGGTGSAPTLSGSLTLTKTDLSMGLITASVTTNEHTTIGLSRAAGTSQNIGTAPAALNGTQASDVAKSFSVTGTGAAMSAGLFDSVTPSGSNLFAEANFSAVANLLNGDTLAVTWTVTF